MQGCAAQPLNEVDPCRVELFLLPSRKPANGSFAALRSRPMSERMNTPEPPASCAARSSSSLVPMLASWMMRRRSSMPASVSGKLL